MKPWLLAYLCAIACITVLDGIWLGYLARDFYAREAAGLLAYGTYDLTNLATLRGFSATMAAVDMAWGTVLSAAAGLCAYAVLNRFRTGPR